ncbi:MAG: hypothetical protein EBU08_12705, partial [Micrococcales bacterium]|nr:hypothetical protein [Micrococcales bacterium]
STLSSVSAANLTLAGVTTGLNAPGISTLGFVQHTTLNVSGFSTLGSISGANLTLAGVTTGLNASGVVTATSFSGSGANLTSLNATQLTTGTVPAARITASSGDFTVGSNLYVNGILSVGGTTVILNVQQLQISDRDITLGVTTDANGVDISTDNTANHGGISVASTVGTPLINIPTDAVNNSPSTYKQIMWVKQGHYTGLATDAWIFNYGVSIGNTSTVQNGSRLTVGAGFTVYDNYLDAQDIRGRNLNIVGVSTLGTASASSLSVSGTSSFIGGISGSEGADLGRLRVTGIATLGQTNTTGFSNAGVSTLGNATASTLVVSGFSTLGITSATNLTAQQLNISGVSTFGGNLIPSSSSVNIGGISNRFGVGYWSDGSHYYGTNKLFVSSGSGFGLEAYVSNAAYLLSNAGGGSSGNVYIDTVVGGKVIAYGSGSVQVLHSQNVKLQTSGVGVTVTGITQTDNLSVGTGGTVITTTSSGLVGIGTTNPTSKLHVVGSALITGVSTIANFSITPVGTGATVGGIGVTYYGDGSQLTGISASGGVSISTNTTNANQYIPYATSFGSTTGFGATTLLVYNPSSGNLGIGTTNPTSSLTVQGSTRITGITSIRDVTIDKSIASPNATVPVAIIGVTTSGISTETNIDVVLLAKGTGATLAQVPDGTVAGGDKRGTGATDWQKSRTAAARVASGAYATITGGSENTASGTYAIAGGYLNTVSGSYATVAGGQNNQASGSHNSALGGYNNNASGTIRATIAGGDSNTASSNYSFVGGGQSNTAQTNTHATVCGGQSNTASGQNAFVGGGGSNNATAAYAFIGGGFSNTASTGTAPTVAGGNNNNASGNYAFIGGGEAHIANANHSVVLGGNAGTVRSIVGNFVFPACAQPISATQGVTQSALLLLARQTTNATATVLTSDQSAASTTNQVILANNAAYFFKGSCIAGVTGAGDTKAWEFKGAIKRGANAAATSIVGS